MDAVKLDELGRRAGDANWRVLRLVRDYLRTPTERNSCYATGYIGAMQDTQAMSSDEAAYWRSVVAFFEGHKDWSESAAAFVQRVYEKRGFAPATAAPAEPAALEHAPEAQRPRGG